MLNSLAINSIISSRVIFTIASLILKLDIPKIKLPQKQILETKKEIKEASQIEDKIENKKDEKKENLNVEEYIKSRLETVHNVDELEDDTNIQINNVKEEKVKDIKEDVKELENKSENNPLEEIKEIENKEKPKIKEETKKENNKQEIEEKEVKEILEKIEKVETIDKKVQIVSELDENKELLKDIEKGKLAKPKDFSLPPLEFLKRPLKRETQVNEEEIDKKVKLLLDKLKNFKIQGDVVRTYTGPVVTTFEFKPLAHIKVSKILNLQDDLAMALKASTIRIQAPVPGKDVVGIEIPNNEIETIYLREILETELFKNSKAPLLIALGKDIVGKPFVTDLAKLPHLLIAGTTGSGKSVGINAMILSLLYRNSPDDLKLMMIDPKMLEFSIYNDIPHLLTPVITEPKKAITGLSNMVKEMERRYKLMSDGKVKNIENYNAKFPENKMPYIVVVIDELADLMMTGGKDVEYSIARLAQMARASGIHLIVATQRPSVDVVTGLIKANLPSRISYKVGQKIDSKVILDSFGAESLLGRGDMLFTPPGSSTLVRLHAPFTTEEEIEKIVEFLKAQRSVHYDENFLAESVDSGVSEEVENRDELYEEAKKIILTEKKTSISYLQRRLQIGYNRAANIIEQLERSGFLSAPNAKGQREILQG
jgi:S-DNA-T family DNA segregation ATPase FtsK/SpoIIIE